MAKCLNDKERLSFVHSNIMAAMVSVKTIGASSGGQERRGLHLANSLDEELIVRLSVQGQASDDPESEMLAVIF